MQQHVPAPAIEVGRRILYTGDICNPQGFGVITAVHGTPSGVRQAGVLRVIRPNECTFDVHLFDGRAMSHVHECGLGGPGARYQLQDRVHGPALIEVAKRNHAKYVADSEAAVIRARVDFEAAEAARVIEVEPLFYWNGIKDAKGAKLQPCWYSPCGMASVPDGTITIYARDYHRFSAVVRACFAVENDTDTMTDYFCEDRFRVIPNHPLYTKVKAALEAQDAHRGRMAQKRRGAA
jgi:hypothetical protein